MADKDRRMVRRHALLGRVSDAVAAVSRASPEWARMEQQQSAVWRAGLLASVLTN